MFLYPVIIHTDFYIMSSLLSILFKYYYLFYKGDAPINLLIV